MDAIHPVKNAANVVGGITALAKELAVTPPTVHQWISGVRPVPVGRCPQIERATSGVVCCEDLRPDVDWAVLRGSSADRAARDAGDAGTREHEAA